MRTLIWPLAGMLLMQTLSALVFLSVPVLAPVLAQDVGIEASRIGIYSSLVFVAAMVVSGISGTLIGRFGAVRAMQAGLCLAALALLLTTHGSLVAIICGALLVGLGYGPNTPGASHVLAHVTPPSRRGLVFSIKQAGAPLGGALAGLILPVAVALAGWRTALLVSALLAVAGVLIVQPLRARHDAARGAAGRVTWAGLLGPLILVLRTPPLRRLTVASFVYAGAQMIVFSIMVAYLVERAALRLEVAGALYAAMQVAGVVARIGWGWVADRFLSPRLVMALLGLAAAAVLLLTIGVGAGWPVAALAGLSVLLGSTISGWNGVFLAEVANVVPPQSAGAATGGVAFFTYAGLVVGPAGFTAVVSLAGYGWGFGLLAAAVALPALWLLLARPER